MNDQQREHFWAKVEKTATCWLWTGATWAGYGLFGSGRDGETRRAHRLAYEDAHGPIPAGLVLDHRCHNEDLSCLGGKIECQHRRCVNPAHLVPVTNRSNVLAGRGVTAEFARRTTCREGHPLEWLWSARQCRQCFNRNQNARRRAKTLAAAHLAGRRLDEEQS